MDGLSGLNILLEQEQPGAGHAGGGRRNAEIELDYAVIALQRLRVHLQGVVVTVIMIGGILVIEGVFLSGQIENSDAGGVVVVSNDAGPRGVGEDGINRVLQHEEEGFRALLGGISIDGYGYRGAGDSRRNGEGRF